MKTDVPLYFFILGLTPLLGVSHSFIHGTVLAGLLMALLVIQGPLLSLVGYRLPDSFRFPVLFFSNLLWVTAADLGMAAVWPSLYPGFGIYLKLMAVNPLILKILSDQARGWDLKESLEYALRTAGGFFVVAAILSFFREVLGAGRLTYGLEGQVLSFPGLSQASFRVLFVGGSGALILAGLLKALQNWGYARGWLWFRQEEPLGHRKSKTPVVRSPEEVKIPSEPEKSKRNHLNAVPASAPAVQIPEPDPEPQPGIEGPSSSGPAFRSEPPTSSEPEEKPQEIPGEPEAKEWGETLQAVLSALGSAKDFEKKRILVIGCGSGEEVYRQAMVLADARRSNPRFSFRIRGVDAFAARLDLAKEGTYREVQLEGVSLEQKQRYLLQNREEGHRLVRIGQELRQYTEFVVSEYLAQGYFFQKPCDLAVVPQDMEFLNPEEKTAFLEQIREHLVPSGAVILPPSWPRELIPAGFKRSGTQVYRKEI